MKTKRRSQQGQALFEYMVIFAFIAVFGVTLFKKLSTALDGTTREIAWYLTQELNIGVCKDQCFMLGYKNK